MYKLLPITTLALLVLAAACVGSKSTGNLSTCDGFLEVSEVEEVSRMHGIHVDLRPLEGDGDRVCDIFFDNGAGNLWLSIFQYDSAATAKLKYDDWLTLFRDEMVVLTEEIQFREGIVGKDSSRTMEDTWSAGSLAPMVVFRQGASIAILMRDRAEPLFESMDVTVELARLVQGRLP